MPIEQLHSLLNIYHWEKYEIFHLFPCMSLNSTTTVLLQGWIWHWITQESWYVIKQRNQTKSAQFFFFLLSLAFFFTCVLSFSLSSLSYTPSASHFLSLSLSLLPAFLSHINFSLFLFTLCFLSLSLSFSQHFFLTSISHFFVYLMLSQSLSLSLIRLQHISSISHSLSTDTTLFLSNFLILFLLFFPLL